MKSIIKQLCHTAFIAVSTNKTRKFGIAFCIALVFAMFLSSNLIAEEINQKAKLNSRAGGTIGLHIPKSTGVPQLPSVADFYSFIGVGLFYRHRLPILSDLYLSANIGYMPYTKSGWIDTKRNDFPITLGFCYYKEFAVNFYAGIEFGMLYRNENYYRYMSIDTDSNFIKPLFCITFGIEKQLSKSINLEINVKNKYILYDTDYKMDPLETNRNLNIFGINLGASYLIP